VKRSDIRTGGAASAPTFARLAMGATLSGTLVLLSFPPFGFGWLMWLALTPLFAVHQRLNRPALVAFGYGLAAVPIWAIAFAIVASSPLVFLAFALSIPLAFAGAIVAAAALESRLSHPLARLFVFPCCAVLVEYVLGTERVGVPATIALSQAGSPLLVQNADLFGTAGTTFLLLLVNRAVAMVADLRHEPETRWPMAVAATIFIANLCYGAYGLVTYGGPGDDFTVTTVQPAIPTADYVNRQTDDAAQQRIDYTIDALVEQSLHAHPDLLVLSEGGNGRYNLRVPALRRRLEETASRNGVGLLVSSLDLNPAGEEYNALFSIGRDGRLLGTHRKSILTPVGEEHLSVGADRAPLPSPIGPIGAMVCFESCFPDVARTLVRNGAAILLVSTSDASFRNSALPLLHSSFSTFRAIENRRYLLQAANTGPSLIVAPTGMVTDRTTFLERGVLSGHIAARTGETMFVRAPWMAAAWALVYLLATLLPQPRVVPAVPPTSWGQTTRHATPSRRASYGLAYGVWVATLAVASVHLATRGTLADRGVIGNLSAFLAPPPVPNIRATTDRYRQRDPNSCGPAALAYLLHLHGIDIDEGDIARHARMENDGTSLLELARAAEAFGLDAQGERLNIAALRTIRRPLIAHLPTRNHFVVVVAVENGSVFFFDPAFGLAQLDEHEFSREWNGFTLRVGFPPSPDLDRAFAPVTEPGSGHGILSTNQTQPRGDTTCKTIDS